MTITNMQQPMQMQAGLGSLQDPRQNYGLGSFVKKAIRGVKKVVKSPLGKMALIGGLGYGLGGAKFLGGEGILAGGQGMARFGNLMNLIRPAATNATGKRGLLSGMFYDKAGKFSAGRAAMTGLGAASLAPLFMGGDNEEVEEQVSQLDPIGTVQSARNYYSGLGDKGVGLNFMPKKKYVDQNFYAADGGRANYAGGEIVEDEEEFTRTNAGQPFRMKQTFLNMGGGAGEAQAEQMLMAEFIKYKNKGGDLSFQEFVQAVMQQQEQAQGMEQPMMAANGGRIGYRDGTPPKTNFQTWLKNNGHTIQSLMQPEELGLLRAEFLREYGADYAHGGRTGYANGGIMDTEASEMIDMGGQEKDYRDEGGFVELGGEERADDVPARLSKNEFVFTADAVRQAGGGDIDEGSAVMQNLMDNLEQGGQVSEDSQGLNGGEEMMSEEEIIEEPNGAQAMYEQQQALQSRMI
jgi:hypothetical protein